MFPQTFYINGVLYCSLTILHGPNYSLGNFHRNIRNPSRWKHLYLMMMWGEGEEGVLDIARVPVNHTMQGWAPVSTNKTVNSHHQGPQSRVHNIKWYFASYPQPIKMTENTSALNQKRCKPYSLVWLRGISESDISAPTYKHTWDKENMIKVLDKTTFNSYCLNAQRLVFQFQMVSNALCFKTFPLFMHKTTVPFLLI